MPATRWPLSPSGVIHEAEDGFVKRQIDHAEADEHVKAVVLRVDSPGGTVSGSDYIYHHLRKLVEKRKIPLVVSMGGMAASGGYYVSMAVGHEPDRIFAEPTCFTGSIGVLMPHYEIAGLLEKIGAKEDSILSNPLKGMGSIARPMTKQEREIFQRLIDDSFAQFKDGGALRPGEVRKGPGRPGQDRHRTGLYRRAGEVQRAGRSHRLFGRRDRSRDGIGLAQKGRR